LLVALVDQQPIGITNLLTRDGCVRGNSCPLIGVLDDLRTRALIAQNDNTLLAVGTLADAIVARAIGVAAAPITPFRSLTKDEFARFKTLFIDGTEPSRESAAAAESGGRKTTETHPAQSTSTAGHVPDAIQSNPPNLWTPPIGICFADFSLARLDRESPKAVRESVAYLLRLERLTQLWLHDIRVWAPNDQAWEGLQLALDQREVSWCRETLRQSIEKDGRSLSFLSRQARRANREVDLAALWRRRRKARRLADSSKAGRDRVERVESAYRRAVEQKMYDPILAEINATKDPIQRTRLFHFLQLNQIFDAKLNAQLASIDKPTQSAAGTKPADRSMADLLSIAQQFIEVAEAIQSSPKKFKGPLFGTR
jgi:lambda repressor-like predicted transcriptional regulator